MSSQLPELKFNFVLTAHAKVAIQERRILAEWVGRVLSNPLKIENDKEDDNLRHALGRIAECEDRVLRVVYNYSARPWLVVTAYFDRKAGRIL